MKEQDRRSRPRLRSRSAHMFVAGACVVSLFVATRAQADFSVAGYDARASQCRFRAKNSFYGYELPGPEPAGEVVVEWKPASGMVTRYEWSLARARRSGPYSTLTPSPLTAPRLARDVTLGPWILSAWVDSHSDTWTLTGRRMVATLFPRHGASPEWHFAGILEETASAYIAATGAVSCEP